MFRSLFVRQMASYLVIILSALAILGVLLYSFFQNYLMETRTEELIRKAKPYPSTSNTICQTL